MENKRNWFIILGMVALAIFFWPRSKEVDPPAPSEPVAKVVQVSQKKPSLGSPAQDKIVLKPVMVRDLKTPPPLEVKAKSDSKPKRTALPYKIQNGLVIVQGDVIVGAPSPGTPPSGLVEFPPLKTWRGVTTVVPYHIQPDLPNPERVLKALAMFDGTAVRFVPQSGEADVLVFEKGEKNCLSYLGKMGGHQPLFLAPGCGPTEIAHEIMHALGFMHEQNRADRDKYINVYPENIEEDEIHNFEKLPKEYMNVSGLGAFDFTSIMIYPPWTFAKNGKSTMEPHNRDQLIQPSATLSPGDIERINRAYGASQ